MGPLIKGLFLGLVGAVVVAPIVLVLALFGLPFLFAAAIVLGVFAAIPIVLLAALTLPFVLLAGLTVAAIVVAVVLAAKLALFVVVPVALIVLALRWLTNSRHAPLRA